MNPSPARFKLDDNLPRAAASLLEQFDFDVETVLSQHLGGSQDQSLAEIVKRENRVLVTLDTDFADVLSYPPQSFSGIVILRLRRQDVVSVKNAIRSMVDALGNEPLQRRLWIVEEQRIRIHSPGDSG